ncbi:PhzF family phenazine biosynthesis protein [Motilibacter aurantiacus]|uniref:PhzF family phenazine biosynthesis protein n=1 Tax=Motilibacter aurantiacus TaxID=2714955 RepID=UPI00140C1AF5|nr:PhzF family phenazine biosynthesis protein [Motilibacter aurantiacus]NHC45708.1 PhzF family phenazine biosynthesis protein [Motilibacter aurantiacus]
MPTLRYEIVDVFTDEPFGGNPLAVVLDAEGLSTEQMQLLAREFNLSETAFPLRLQPGDAPGADYRIRIFSPAVELPFAGHPSVGTAWLMAALQRVEPGRVVQRCLAGDMPLEIEPGAADGIGPGLVTLTGGTPRVSAPLETAPYAAAVGVAADAPVSPVRAAGAGIDWVYVRLADEAAVAASLGDDGALLQLPHPEAYAFCWDAGSSTAYARGWAGGVGIHEDPATGSAALGLGAYLVAEGLLAADGTSAYTVRQGVDMGRPSTLACTVTAEGGVATRVTVAGTAAPTARGEILVP